MFERDDYSNCASATKQNSLFSGQNTAQAADDNASGDGDFEAGVATRVHEVTKRPALYRVLLLNDDYTPMDFVILILQEVFHKSHDEAMVIMLTVHNKGEGDCGIFPYEVAETKVTHVLDMAMKSEHPLQCVMEKQ